MSRTDSHLPKSEPRTPTIYALPEIVPLAMRVASAIEIGWAPVEIRTFDDREFKIRPLADPAGRACIVVAQLHGDLTHSPQDRLCMLLFLIAALKDHHARRVDLLIPYLAYARKDRRTQALDPVSLRYVAQLIEAAGADSISTIEVHQPAAFDNAFRIPATALPGHRMLADRVSEALLETPEARWVIGSPDPGGVKRAQIWREALLARPDSRSLPSIGFASLDKRRALGVLTGAEQVCGDVEGASVVLIDDLIVSGHTLALAAQALRQAGARRVIAAVSHDLRTPGAQPELNTAGIERLITSDTIPESIRPEHTLASGHVDRVSCDQAMMELARRIIA